MNCSHKMKLSTQYIILTFFILRCSKELFQATSAISKSVRHAIVRLYDFLSRIKYIVEVLERYEIKVYPALREYGHFLRNTFFRKDMTRTSGDFLEKKMLVKTVGLKSIVEEIPWRHSVLVRLLTYGLKFN